MFSFSLGRLNIQYGTGIHLTFLKLFTTVFSQWDFSSGKFRLPSPGKASCDSHATQPMVHAGCFGVSIIHQTLTWTLGLLTFAQMIMHMIAHGGVRTKWESLHWKMTLGEKSLAVPGNRTCVSDLMIRCSTIWATSPPFLNWKTKHRAEPRSSKDLIWSLYSAKHSQMNEQWEQLTCFTSPSKLWRKCRYPLLWRKRRKKTNKKRHKPHFP